MAVLAVWTPTYTLCACVSRQSRVRWEAAATYGASCVCISSLDSLGKIFWLFKHNDDCGDIVRGPLLEDRMLDHRLD